jgi:type IV pilus modification protein PilV
MSDRPATTPRNATTGTSGFTMIEMLIALLVLVGGMVSVLALFSTSLSVHRSAVDDTRAALLAEEALDRIRVTWNETGDAAKVAALDLDDASLRPYRVEAEVEPGDEGGATLAVQVRVSWTRGRSERTSRFESVLLRDAFGPGLQALRAGAAPTPPGGLQGGKE